MGYIPWSARDDFFVILSYSTPDRTNLLGMLDRVAMHQTRLKLPGLGIDGKGVALGARGLVLLASIERLVAFLALYTSSHSLSDLLASMRIEVVCSKMGTREIIVSFSAESSERMDVISEVARVALGHTFTGTNRHFVQYRDAGAPFGYDVVQVMASDGDYLLYHNTFSQLYSRERDLDLPGLLMRLHPMPDPSFEFVSKETLLLAEEGLGPAVIQYLIRSHVDARVGTVEWPPPSALDDTNVRRYLFQIPDLPARMLPMVRSTPGLTTFRSVAPGVAVQVGFRHPITLRACPVFSDNGLVLFRGDEQEPLIIEKMPAMGDVSAFAHVTLHKGAGLHSLNSDELAVQPVRVPIRLLASVEPWSNVRATFVHPSEYPLLRQMLYILGSRTLQTATIAFAKNGAFLLNSLGVESTPVGHFLKEVRAGVYVAAGYDPVPAIDPDVLFRALGSPADQYIFMLPPSQAWGVARSAFVPVKTAMIEGHAWAPLDASPLETALGAGIPHVVFGESASAENSQE